MSQFDISLLLRIGYTRLYCDAISMSRLAISTAVVAMAQQDATKSD